MVWVVRSLGGGASAGVDKGVGLKKNFHDGGGGGRGGGVCVSLVGGLTGGFFSVSVYRSVLVAIYKEEACWGEQTGLGGFLWFQKSIVSLFG